MGGFRALIAALIVCALAALGYVAVTDPEDDGASTDPSGSPGAAPAVRVAEGTELGYADTRIDNRPRQQLPQTSDGVPGEIAPPIPHGLRDRRSYEALSTRMIVRGVRFERFAITDYRGRIQGQLLRVNPAAPGVRLDYAGRQYVASVAPLGALLGAQAVAAINGDFFDIADTGAPLGVGRDRERGALHGREKGWNVALYLDRRNTWHIGPISATAKVVEHPELRITTINNPAVRLGEIGLYTGKWGVRQNYRVWDYRQRDIRRVVVQHGRVVANRTDLATYQPIRGQVLVGHGRGADQLARLRVGTPITIRVRYAAQPRVVITGNTRLLKHGTRVAIDDREMHPRTSVGIDRDTGEILMLVIDGRQYFSRGYTMVELANLMREFGAEDAINLDGGGSSTIMGRSPVGVMAILNSPSDGAPRPIPNGLQVLYNGP